MSAGTFVNTRYATNSDAVHPIRVQPETIDLVIDGQTNNPTASPVDQEVTARARGSRRAYGVTARKVSLAFTGVLPSGYSGDTVEVPILTQGMFNAIRKGQTGTYLGADVEVVSKTNEQVR